MGKGGWFDNGPRVRKLKSVLVQCKGVRGRVCLGRVRETTVSGLCMECASIQYRINHPKVKVNHD